MGTTAHGLIHMASSIGTQTDMVANNFMLESMTKNPATESGLKSFYFAISTGNPASNINLVTVPPGRMFLLHSLDVNEDGSGCPFFDSLTNTNEFWYHKAGTLTSISSSAGIPIRNGISVTPGTISKSIYVLISGRFV